MKDRFRAWDVVIVTMIVPLVLAYILMGCLWCTTGSPGCTRQDSMEAK